MRQPTLLLLSLLLLGKSVAPANSAICPRIFAPVCAATVAHQLSTFANRCEARAASAIVLHDGKCNGTFCGHYCVKDRGAVAKSIMTGAVKTYDNVCWAEKNFAAFVKYGPCPSP
jgi:hypothetical protein